MKLTRIAAWTVCLSGLCACSNSGKEVKDYLRFYPGQEWLDQNGLHINAHGGGILYHEGTYYWYGEHKVEGKAGNTAQIGVRVYSSGDLYNWVDEGIALRVTADDTTSEIAKGCILDWLPVRFSGDRLILEWKDAWDLGVFDRL